MDLSTVRQLALELNFSAHGIPVIVKPLNGFTVETTGIWMVPETEQLPGGADFQRTNARRIMAIRADVVPELPRKSTVTIPVEPLLDEIWVVDGIPTVDGDHYHVALVRES